MSSPPPPQPPPVAPEAASSSIIEPLVAWTQYSLQNHLHENAVFLAERVCAESPSDSSKLLLATCHYAAGAANRAVEVLKGCTAPQNRYLLALCCMRLGRLLEAQNALLGSSTPDTDATASLPNGAAGLYLMGMVCLKMQQRQRAIKYLTRCLGINPFLWSAYEALSQLGAPLPDGLAAPPPPNLGLDGAMPVPIPPPGGPSDFSHGLTASTPLVPGSISSTPMRTPVPVSAGATPLDIAGGSGVPTSAAPPSAVALSAQSDAVSARRPAGTLDPFPRRSPTPLTHATRARHAAREALPAQPVALRTTAPSPPSPPLPPSAAALADDAELADARRGQPAPLGAVAHGRQPPARGRRGALERDDGDGRRLRLSAASTQLGRSASPRPRPARPRPGQLQ